MGSAIFTSGPFNAQLCADACSMKSAYNKAHPPTDGSPVQTCQFFNTYILYMNGPSNPQGQYCAMYSESWPASYATNKGQYRGSDQFTIQYSFAYSNSADPGAPCKDCAVHQASRDISYSSLQPYCSSLLGYTIPVATATVTATQTPSTITTTTSKRCLFDSIFAALLTRVLSHNVPHDNDRPSIRQEARGVCNTHCLYLWIGFGQGRCHSYCLSRSPCCRADA